jgi:hypothetical protein
VALMAAAVFFAASLFGSAGGSTPARSPRPVIVEVTGPQPPRGGQGSGEDQTEPLPPELELEEVEHEVKEGEVEDYDDHGGDEGPEDNSGPGSENSGSGSDDSGSGSDDSGSGDDDSGSGSDDSGSDDSGSGSSGSGGEGSDDR